MGTLKVFQVAAISSPPARLWPLLADTDRINRASGIAPVAFEKAQGELVGGSRLRGNTRSGLVALAYEERPFEWVQNQSYSVRRVYDRGPMRWMEVQWTLVAPKEAPNTSPPWQVELRIESASRSTLWSPIVWLGLWQTARNLMRTTRALDAHLAQQAPSPYAMAPPVIDRKALERARSAYASSNTRESIQHKLIDHLRTSPDVDCANMRPYELAEAWGEPPRDVLRGCLHAVSHGLLELEWAIICPSCRTTAEAVPSLDKVPTEGHCHFCDISFDLPLDEAVEAQFRPHPGLRKVPRATFCLGGPSRTPHVHSQVVLEPGEEKPLSVPTEPGRYRVFVRGGRRASVTVSPSAASHGTLLFDEERCLPSELHIAPGGWLAATKKTQQACHVKLERLDHASTAATVHDISLLPEFRRLFSRELVKEATPLKVTHACILFTDLTGSTALYSSLGDSTAFRVVDDHFDVLRIAIEEAGGTLVKTMGDAVLAAFPDAHSGCRAALGSLVRFEDFRRSRSEAEGLQLKLGCYTGTSFMISANGSLDYFGQTVNIASRLQHLASGGEVVIPREDLPSVEESLAHGFERSPPEVVHVKGVPEGIEIVRLRRIPSRP